MITTEIVWNDESTLSLQDAVPCTSKKMFWFGIAYLPQRPSQDHLHIAFEGNGHCASPTITTVYLILPQWA